MTHTARAFAVALAALMIVGVSGIVGCPFTPDKGGGDDDPAPVIFKPRTSPQNLLHNLQKAYEKREIAEYESLLSAEDPAFTFLLSEFDASQPGMDDSWGRDEEIEIHRNIFDSEQVETLTLSFQVGDETTDPENGWRTIKIYNIELRLRGIIPGREDEGLQWLEVENAESRFWFKQKDWTYPGTNDKVWAIVQWEDNPPS